MTFWGLSFLLHEDPEDRSPDLALDYQRLMSGSHADNGKCLMYQKKIISYQIQKPAI